MWMKRFQRTYWAMAFAPLDWPSLVKGEVPVISSYVKTPKDHQSTAWKNQSSHISDILHLSISRREQIEYDDSQRARSSCLITKSCWGKKTVRNLDSRNHVRHPPASPVQEPCIRSCRSKSRFDAPTKKVSHRLYSAF